MRVLRDPTTTACAGTCPRTTDGHTVPGGARRSTSARASLARRHGLPSTAAAPAAPQRRTRHLSGPRIIDVPLRLGIAILYRAKVGHEGIELGHAGPRTLRRGPTGVAQAHGQTQAAPQHGPRSASARPPQCRCPTSARYGHALPRQSGTRSHRTGTRRAWNAETAGRLALRTRTQKRGRRRGCGRRRKCRRRRRRRREKDVAGQARGAGPDCCFSSRSRI
jgi:hypothetical protein